MSTERLPAVGDEVEVPAQHVRAFEGGAHPGFVTREFLDGVVEFPFALLQVGDIEDHAFPGQRRLDLTAGNAAGADPQVAPRSRTDAVDVAKPRTQLRIRPLNGRRYLRSERGTCWRLTAGKGAADFLGCEFENLFRFGRRGFE